VSFLRLASLLWDEQLILLDHSFNRKTDDQCHSYFLIFFCVALQYAFNMIFSGFRIYLFPHQIAFQGLTISSMIASVLL